MLPSYPNLSHPTLPPNLTMPELQTPRMPREGSSQDFVLRFSFFLGLLSLRFLLEIIVQFQFHAEAAETAIFRM